MSNLFEVATNIYHYGSYVYGTYTDGVSDKDYIVIVPDDTDFPEQIDMDNCNFNIYKNSLWKEKLKNNDIECLECLFLDKRFIIKEDIKYDFILNKNLIRKNISSTASNSFVKCKKKLTVKDSYSPRIGKKSLWHSLRLLDFGIQIMKYDKIIDYSSANKFYQDIMNMEDDWEKLKETYQPVYNNYKTNFKIEHNCALER